MSVQGLDRFGHEQQGVAPAHLQPVPYVFSGLLKAQRGEMERHPYALPERFVRRALQPGLELCLPYQDKGHQVYVVELVVSQQPYLLEGFTAWDKLGLVYYHNRAYTLLVHRIKPGVDLLDEVRLEMLRLIHSQPAGESAQELCRREPRVYYKYWFVG